MDATVETAADEIRRLKGCISDLVGVFGLRAVWSGGDPSRIVGTLLDVLVGTLRLDFAYARFRDPVGGITVESARVQAERDTGIQASELGRRLDARLSDHSHTAHLRMPDPFGDGDVSIMVVRLGLEDGMGVVVAGSSRLDFPLQTERLFVNVATNQAVIGLHEGRRLTRAERERIELQERLRQAEKMEAIGRFASGIAHDFNSVLGGIMAYGEMLLDELPEHTEPQRYAQSMMIAATRGHHLVNQILAYTRSQRGKRTPTDVCDTVREALDLVRGSVRASITLRAEIPEGPLVVMGDATQLHQVVVNLCSNAIHSMLEAGGTLSVGIAQQSVDAARSLSQGALARGHYVRLSVQDTGHGMDPATLARIFEPFFTTKETGQGTGLGLALVYAIVADFGGAIDVRSVIGEGSTFETYLPIAVTSPP